MDKLAQDSTDAIKAGMSYGKYMAMKKPVEVTMKDENHYICEFCGKAFYTKYHKGQKYCSPECQEKAKDRRQSERKKSEKPPIIKTCGICGKEFIGKNVQAKYCGDDCRYVANLAAMRAYSQKIREGKKNELLR